MPDVVITGASTGIGFAACQALVRSGCRVFGSVRTKADADRLTEQLGRQYVPLIFDATDPGSVNQVAAGVKEMLGEQRLVGLVNNAGIAILGPWPVFHWSAFASKLRSIFWAFIPSRKAGTPNSTSSCKRCWFFSSLRARTATAHPA